MDAGRPLQLGGELAAIHQHLSHTYDEPELLRYEATGSVVIYRYFQSSVKTVSTYLKGDRFGQIFWEIIGINIPY